jgi:hypothetical protein
MAIADTAAASAPEPWEQQPGEGGAAFTRFAYYLNAGGPRRTLADTARAFAVSVPTIHEQSRRYRWAERVAAFDEMIAAVPVSTRLEAAAQSAPMVALSDEAKEREAKFYEHLDAYRSDIQALGEGQLKAARGLAAAAGRGLAQLVQDKKQLSARDIAALATASASLGAAGAHHWTNALGLKRFEQTIAAILEADIEEEENRQTLENARVDVVDVG